MAARDPGGVGEACETWRVQAQGGPVTTRALEAILNRAAVPILTWGYLDANHLRSVKKLQEPDGRLRYLDTEEIDRLLTACPAHLHPIVVCAHQRREREEVKNRRASNPPVS